MQILVSDRDVQKIKHGFLLVAYKFIVLSQMGAVDVSFDEIPNIFDTGAAKGLPGDSVEKIPKIIITGNNNVDASGDRVSCSVCLQVRP